MKVKYLNPLLALIFTVLALACAKVGSLQGGAKDTVPPEVVADGSTPNFTTRFTERRIELRFNEWVTLSDIAAQVLISPPMTPRPQVTLKGKTVRVELDKACELRPNTTYAINFGTAVKDFTENNPAKDLRFVFSTGEYLDSLKVTGLVADAFSGEPLENMSVWLYDRLDDSVARRETPYYVARTDKTGAFSIGNVRVGVFKIIAVEDADQNLKWAETERIGFLETPLTLGDSASGGAKPVRILASKETPVFRSLDRDAARYGFAKIAYNGPPPPGLEPAGDRAGVRFLTERSADSLLIWYDFPSETLVNPWKMAVGKDTLAVKALSRDEFLKSKTIAFAGEAPPAGLKRPSGKKQPPAPAAPLPGEAPPGGKTALPPPVRTVLQSISKPAALAFNMPVVAADTARWLLLEDTARLRVTAFSVAPDSTRPRSLMLTTHWKSGKNYALLLLPGAVTDFYGRPNADTLRRNFNVPPDKTLGSIHLTLKKLTPGGRYVFQLLNGMTVSEERIFSAPGPEQVFSMPNLPTASYTLQVIEDRNGNGRWDPGAYFEHRPPEAVFVKQLEALRPNWELETVFELGAAEPKKKK